MLANSFPDSLWLHLASRFAVDPSPGVEDPRFDEAKFCEGYGMSIYWASLGRMMCPRALLDAATLAQPLVLLQAADQCAELDKETAFRFLNRPNPYRTGHMHRIFPCHVGTQVRLIAKLDAEKGMIQDTVGTIMDLEFHSADRDAYTPGRRNVFSALFAFWDLAVCWLYQGCSDWHDLMELDRKHVSDSAAEKLPRESNVAHWTTFATNDNVSPKRCRLNPTMSIWPQKLRTLKLIFCT